VNATASKNFPVVIWHHMGRDCHSRTLLKTSWAQQKLWVSAQQVLKRCVLTLATKKLGHLHQTLDL
jgi:hypothetical protein